jgi:hypothetical protein
MSTKYNTWKIVKTQKISFIVTDNSSSYNYHSYYPGNLTKKTNNSIGIWPESRAHSNRTLKEYSFRNKPHDQILTHTHIHTQSSEQANGIFNKCEN